MVLLAIGVILLALFYQNRMFRLKKSEAFLRLRAILNKEQEERTRISADLHDTVSGNLSSINIYFSLLKNRIEDTETLEIINEAADELRNTQEKIRRITYNLMPPILVTSGFVPSLEDYLRKRSARNEFAFDLQDMGFVMLSQQSSYEVLLILREFITNSCTHGETKNIKITLSSTKNFNIITYIDDGRKYDFYKEIQHSSGYGLKNIQARVENLNGHLRQLDSIIGNHFVIFVKNGD
jgi:signal transduction histidine kinase